MAAQQCLSAQQGIFILCDVRNKSFPICYASPGFQALFEYSEAECVGTPCWELLGGATLKADRAALSAVAREMGMAEAEAIRGIDTLTCHAAEQSGRMLRNPQEEVGFGLLVNRKKKSGTILVCEQLMLVLDRPELGWSYAIGIQRDITQEIPVGTLLRAAARGEFEAITEARLEGMKGRLASHGIGRTAGGVVGFVQSAAKNALQSERAAPLANSQPGVATLQSRGLAPSAARHGHGHHRGRHGHRGARTSAKAPHRTLGRIEESCMEESSMEEEEDASGPGCTESGRTSPPAAARRSSGPVGSGPTAHVEASSGPPGVWARAEGEDQPSRPGYVLLGREHAHGGVAQSKHAP